LRLEVGLSSSKAVGPSAGALMGVIDMRAL
jgi:hypothetical protein